MADPTYADSLALLEGGVTQPMHIVVFRELIAEPNADGWVDHTAGRIALYVNWDPDALNRAQVDTASAFVDGLWRLAMRVQAGDPEEPQETAATASHASKRAETGPDGPNPPPDTRVVALGRLLTVEFRSADGELTTLELQLADIEMDVESTTLRDLSGQVVNLTIEEA